MFSFIQNLFYYNSENNYKNLEQIKEHIVNTKTKEEFLDQLMKNSYKKLNLNDQNYHKLIKNYDIENNHLLFLENDLYNALQKVLKYHEYVKSNNPLTKNKFRVNPKFSKNDFEKYHEPTESNHETNSNVNLELKIEESLFKFNNDEITVTEFNENFKEKKQTIDMFGITKLMLSDLSDLSKQQIVNKYNEILQQPELCAEYNIGRNFFMYKAQKKGKVDDLKSFRQVIAIPVAVSHFHRIMAIRMNDYLVKNKYIDTTIQKAGISDLKLGMFEQIIKLKNIIKDANKNSKPLCVMYIDVSDAFPSMKIDNVCHVLKKYNVPDNIISYIKCYYQDFKYYSGTKDWSSDITKWNKGLLQGCPMSPILFVTVINYILKYLQNKYDNASYKINNEKKALFLAYMDDIAITTQSLSSMKYLYSELEQIFKDFGLFINKNKTKLMLVNCKNEFDIGIEVVNKYKYLGQEMLSNGDSYSCLLNLLYMLRQKLSWVDKLNITKEEKLGHLTSKILPIVQRKLSILYDINFEDKLNILRLIKTYSLKWSQEDIEINVAINLKEIFANTSDEILQNLDFVDDRSFDNISLGQKCVMKLSEIGSLYENINK